MDLSTWALLVIAVVALAGVPATGLRHGAGGLIGAPVLSLIVGPVAGVLIINVLAAVNAIFRTLSVRENVDGGSSG